MATQITNTASATYGYGGRAGIDSAISNTTSTSLIQDYALSAEKSSLNSGFRAGENITYQIVLTNEGTQGLYNATVSDDLGGATNPLTYVTGSGTLNINGVNQPIVPTSVRPLVFTISTPLQANDIATITYVARVNQVLPDEVNQIVNTATVTANEGSAGGPLYTVTPSPSFTLNRENYAQVSVTKSASQNVITVGEPFSYVLTLENTGNLPAMGTVITDTLPQNFAISSITYTDGGVTQTLNPDQYSVDPSTNTLTAPTDAGVSIDVPVGGTTTITINGSITA